jgi:hypothetical protein
VNATPSARTELKNTVQYPDRLSPPQLRRMTWRMSGVNAATLFLTWF